MTDRNPDISRDKIEKLLHETFGFTKDQAVMDAVLLTIDAYAVALAHDLAGSPVMVREGYVHLLMQQAELLLDSGGRLAQTFELAQMVERLSGTVGAIDAARMDFTVKALARLDETFEAARRRAPEHTEEQMQAYADSYQVSEQNAGAPEGLIPDDISAILDKEAAEAEAVAEAEEAKWDLLDHRDAAVIADWEAALLNTQQCSNCKQWKELNADNFWRNHASPSGYEKRCTTCRRAEKTARRRAMRAA